ncbi:MAG: type I-MYXAN CRISPR-associated protein Cas5/Cmx5/DevS [Deltaproteobacteria bacterium]|nr:type I-MYXAN CRISPR-associated protein Cas5/Cmx5/DevS [Deltaproteobacteria bacterium]
MIALELTVPFACWRKGHAREFVETSVLPPPATCYGALLSLVGETDPQRHRGCRVTAGLLNEPQVSVVLRTFWQIKKLEVGQGRGPNAGPDYQQLVVGAKLVVWCDSADEPDPAAGLEARVRRAMRDPGAVSRFGGWSLGESTHLINDARLLDGGAPPGPCRTFVTDPTGTVTMPVWVDHVGAAGTRYATGRLEQIDSAPGRARLPLIPLAAEASGA